MIQTKKGMGKRWKPFYRSKGFQSSTKGIYASHNVTFDVGKGEIFALIGPNGAGKTTTIRMISTLCRQQRATLSWQVIVFSLNLIW